MYISYEYGSELQDRSNPSLNGKEDTSKGPLIFLLSSLLSLSLCFVFLFPPVVYLCLGLASIKVFSLIIHIFNSPSFQHLMRRCY